MHRTILVLAAAALVCGATLAQTAVKRTAAGKVAPTKKPASRKPPARTSALATPLPPPNDEQRGAAELAYVGDYACEFNQTLSVAPNPTYEAYVDVRFGKRLFTMKPVLSSTGALRLEEVAGDALMIQIPFKSMLLDNRLGRRLVDECVHEKQSLAKLSAAKEPPGPGLGIDPSRAVANEPQTAPSAAASAPAAAVAPPEAASAPEPAPAGTPRN